MWQSLRCLSVTVTIGIFVCILILCFGKSRNSKLLNSVILKKSVSNSSEDKIASARKGVKVKEKIHVPKFMLDLYKERNGCTNLTGADVVRSVIPRSAGKGP